jgi:tRNA threonylcarbamoyladenosine biosynthesis protein TsaE
VKKSRISKSFISFSAEQTFKAGQSLGQRIYLKPSWQKDIFLFGEMGSGKTHFTKGLAKSLDSNLKIKSPTYNLINEQKFFKSNQQYKLAHFDLYRLGERASSDLLEIIQEKFQDPHSINVIEWSERLPKDFELPKNRLEIHFSQGQKASERELTVKFFDPGRVSFKEARAITKEFATPYHIQEHEKGVAFVAGILAEKVFTCGNFVDIKLVITSAMLHDFVRYINFPVLDFSQFKEAITPEKIRIWQDTTAKYSTMHHGDVGAEILINKGFNSTAEVIAHHKSSALLHQKELTLEEEIVHFADKKVLHDHLVTLSERFKDGDIRHNWRRSQDQKDELRAKVRTIGNKLFTLAGFENEQDFDT